MIQFFLFQRKKLVRRSSLNERKPIVGDFAALLVEETLESQLTLRPLEIELARRESVP